MEYFLTRERRRSISITVTEKGVKVKAPNSIPLFAINNFVRSKTEWIEKKVAEIEKSKQLIRNSGFYVDKVPYLGESYGLETREANVREKISFADGRFVAHVKKNSDSDRIEKLYSSWLRKKATEVFSDKVDSFGKILKVKPARIAIRSQRSRWGSASGKGNLNFNFHLLKAPMGIVDYVVVHELCHLKIYNHSKRFWNLVESLVPDYREKRRWLKKNGLHLMRGAV